MENSELFTKTITELAQAQALEAVQHHAERHAHDTQLYLNAKLRTQKAMDNLVYRIFWEEKLEAEALRLYLLNKKSKDADLLAWALQCQNYRVAEELLRQGAQADAAHEDILNFSLSRGTYAHVRQDKPIAQVKRFGLALGINATIGGIASQRSNMQQPFHMLCDQVNQYTNKLDANHPFKSEFNAIAEAYAYSEKAIQFSGNRASDNAGHLLAKRYAEGKITVVPCGWKGHAIAVSIVNNHLVLTNRGNGGDNQFGTQIYKIAHPEKVNATFFQTLASAVQNNATPRAILNTIGEVIDKAPVLQIAQKKQKRENCAYANPKANMEGILAVLACKDNRIVPNSEAHAAYKAMTHTFRRDLAGDLVARYQISYGSERSMYYDLMQAYIQEHSGVHAKAIDQEVVALMLPHVQADVGNQKAMLNSNLKNYGHIPVIPALKPNLITEVERGMRAAVPVMA